MSAVPSDAPAADETRTVCPYCGTGCGVLVETEGEGAARRVTGVRGDPDHPANRGRLCAKGASLHLAARPVVFAQARVQAPELRTARDAPRARVDWDTALEHAADRFASIIRAHGPDAVAFLVSGQLLTEDYHVFNVLARGLVGTNNIDSNSRLCMSSAVAGHKAVFGTDAVPACYDDIEAAECIVLAGSNAAHAHPVLFARIEAARAARPGTKLVVIDPRRTDTAARADLHLQLKPGTDVALFHGMLNLMLWEGLVDHAWIERHASGFDALRTRVRDTTPAVAARLCGLREEDIARAARWFATSPATLSMWCQGLNQAATGTDRNAALLALHLACGQIGRPGAGPLSLTGQPNAMGGRETGAMATLLPGHRDPADPTDRAELARLWGVHDLPAAPGLSAVELFDALHDGRVKAVWIACTNPAHSMPDAARVREALERAEFVVVQEAFRGTATARFADLLLPATTWPEKSGTVTNSERRVSRVRAALPAWGEARHDRAIAGDFGRRLERRLPPRTVAGGTLFPWTDDEDGARATWEAHRAGTVGRDLDIGGLSWALLDGKGPRRWPFPVGATEGVPRLFADGRFGTPDGRARFPDAPWKPVAEEVDARRPFALLSGRLRDQWHGGSRSGLVARLWAHAPEPSLDMHPDDAGLRGWRAGDLLRVDGRRGAIVLPLRLDAGLRRGQCFAAMHWGPEVLGGDGVNRLALAALDPASRQPELKHAAVRLERVDLPGRVVAFGWLPEADAHALRRAAVERFGAVAADGRGYLSVTLFGRERTGVLLRLARDAPVDEDALRWIGAAFGAPPHRMLRYDDPVRRSTRRLLVRDDALRFALLAGDARSCGSEGWLRDWLEEGRPVTAPGRALLRPGAVPPSGPSPRGRTVCVCKGVDERAIRDCAGRLPADDARRLALVRATLQCGSGCGACVPEVARLVSETPAAVAGSAA